MIDALIRLGDLDGARAHIAAIPVTSASHLTACAKAVLIGILADDPDEARAAIARIGTVGDGVYAAAYGAAVVTLEPDAALPSIPPGVDRPGVFAALIELAGTLLELSALEQFNGIVPLLYATTDDRRDADRRLGYLLYINDFPDPAADRLMAAVEAGDTTPEAFAALGRICQSKHLDEDAETFLRAALETDSQNMTRHLDLAGLLAGYGRYGDADDVLREGLLVYPHSSVLRELRQSMSLLAASRA